MKQYFPNERHNKAAMILASMSSDMVQDIADLFAAKGHAVAERIADDPDGAPKPLAMFSRDFIADQDFSAVYVGFCAMAVAQFKTLAQDNDFYQKVLVGAFNLSPSMANHIALTIETRDPIGGYAKDATTGSDKYQIKTAWYSKVYDQIAESTRRLVNRFGSIVNPDWENDQNQKYDLDFLYELRLLGLAVDDLSARARLMSGQYSISRQLGIMQAGDAASESEQDASIRLMETVQPLVGTPLPAKVYGALSKLVANATKAARADLDKTVAAGGAGNSAKATDPNMASAVNSVLSQDLNAIMQLNPAVIGSSVIQSVAAQLRSQVAKGDTSDVYATVRELYGDAVAQAWNDGDLPGLMTNIIDIAGNGIESTGDPELDEALITEALDDFSSWGDVYEDSPELGGLFKRAGINARLRRAAKQGRKGARRQARLARKDVQNQADIDSRAALNAGRYAAQRAHDAAERANVADHYTQLAQDEIRQPYTDELEYNPQFTDNGFSEPDDPYNLNSYFSQTEA